MSPHGGPSNLDYGNKKKGGILRWFALSYNTLTTLILPLYNLAQHKLIENGPDSRRTRLEAQSKHPSASS